MRTRTPIRIPPWREKLIRAEYPDSQDLPELAQRCGVAPHTLRTYAASLGVRRTKAAAEAANEVAHDFPKPDTSGIVEQAVASRTELEKAWS